MKNIDFNVIKKSKAVLVLKICISFIILYYIIKTVDFSIITTLDFSIWIIFIIAIIITLLTLLLMSIRWKWLINSIKEENPDIKDLYSIYLISMFFNIFLPGAMGGDLSRIHYSNNKYNLGIKNSGLIVFIERTIGLLATTFFLFTSSIFFFNQMGGFYFGGYIFLVLFGFSVIFLFFLKKFKKSSLKLSILIYIFFISFIVQLADFCIIYLYCIYFNQPLSFFQIMFIVPIVFISSIIPISFGGLGVREGVMASLFSIMGADASVAVIISLLSYSSKVITGLIGGLVYIKK